MATEVINDGNAEVVDATEVGLCGRGYYTGGEDIPGAETTKTSNDTGLL